MARYGPTRGVFILCLALEWMLSPSPFYPGDLHAQESQAITLLGALRMALEENLPLKQSQNAVSTRHVALREARAAFYPYVSLSMSAAKEYVPGTNISVPGQVFNPGGETVTATLSSNLNLFSGFGDVATLEQSQKSLRANEASYSFDRQSLIFQTVSQYIQVVENLDLVRTAEENRKAQQQQLEQIEQFQKLGNRAISDVLQQRANVKQAELQVLTAKRNYEVSRFVLLQTLGQAPTAPLEFASLDIERINSFVDAQELVAETDTTFQSRQDLRSQELQLAAAKQGIRAASAGFWPAITLSADASSSYRSTIGSYGFSDQLRQNRVGTVGLSFSLPLFDRLITLHNVERARIQLSDQQLSLENLRLAVRSDYKQAMLDYRTAIEQRTVAQAQYEFTQEALKIVQARYNVGSATFVELSLAQAQDLSARYNLIGAEYNKLLKYLAVRYQQGDIEAGISVLSAP